jgi:hypothetical protein
VPGGSSRKPSDMSDRQRASTLTSDKNKKKSGSCLLQ